MPRVNLVEGEYYHIYNRGIEDRVIFVDDADRWRFLTLLVVLQGDVVFHPTSRFVTYVKHRMFDNKAFKELARVRQVELVCFCLMSNHFHLILRGTKNESISRFMQRLLNAYTKYFNTRYERKGHLFSGKFQSVHVDVDSYLNYLSAYIHLNPSDIKKWSGKEITYPWSSYQDYAIENRWGSFLDPSVVMDQFSNYNEYYIFVEDSPIKNHVPPEHLMDENK